MKSLLTALWQDESGATAIEYGLIVGLMAAVLISVLSGFGSSLTSLFEKVNGQLQQAANNIGGVSGGGS